MLININILRNKSKNYGYCQNMSNNSITKVFY